MLRELKKISQMLLKNIMNQTKLIVENGKQYIVEGKARIVTKKVTQKDTNTAIEEEVFYNPVQIFNRDMTVLAIQTFAKQQREQWKEKFTGINILDALSASGLRSVRFAQEIEESLVAKIYANDISTASLSLIQENVEANGLQNGKIVIHHMDANRLLFESALNVNNAPKFDVIDLDPYGSVGPFLDGAIHACNNFENRETLLCITCTDSRVLCGPDQQKCFSQYGTARVKMQAFAENGIRSLLYTIASAAGRLGKTMKPLLAIYGEFYLRVFVSVKRDKPGTHKLMSQIGNLFVCSQCTAFWTHPYGQEQETDKKNIVYKVNKTPPKEKCNVCGGNIRINGPVWLDNLNDVDFVSQMQDELKNFADIFQSYKKVSGKLQGIMEQIRFEKCPYSYNFNWITSHLNSSNISKKEIFSGIQSLGFDIAQGYLQEAEYKTNAPPRAVFDVVKAWKQWKYKDTYLKNVKEDSYSYTMLTAPLEYNPDFTVKPQNIAHIKQFLPNPDKNWGPKQRAVQKKVINLKEQEEENGQLEHELQKKQKIE